MQTEEIPGHDGGHIMHAVISAASAIDHICGAGIEWKVSSLCGVREGAEREEESECDIRK